MKTRLFFAALIAAATMLLAACGGASPTAIPTRGFWEGDTFVSSFFGLRFELPENWSAMPAEEIGEMYWNMGFFVPPPGAEIDHEEYEVFEAIGMIEMLAAIGEPDTLSDVTGRVVLSITRMADDVAHMSAPQWLAYTMDAAEVGYIVSDDTVRIGSLYWYYMDSPAFDLFHQRTYANIDNQFLRIITVGYTETAYHDYILGLFAAY